MQKLVLLSLLLLVASKNTIIEFEKDTPFDKDNTEFEFICQNNGVLFFYISCDYSNNIMFYLSEGESQKISSTISKPGFGSMIKIENGKTYKMKFEYRNPNNDKGTIWINPSYNEINVDLNEIYKGKFDLHFPSKDDFRQYKLTYVINKADKDVIFKFNYNKKMNIDSHQVQVENPFQICHGEECLDNISTYEFEKGESYKIYLNINKISIFPLDHYYLPLFSFYDKDKDGTNNSPLNLKLNLWIISLILLIL